MENGRTGLRPPGDEDLEPDHLLAGFFLIDFQHLTRLERRILLAIGQCMMTTEQELLADLTNENPQRIRTFLWGLEKLGHVRQLYGQLTIGNEYLRRWMQAQREHLERMNDTPLAEESIEQLLQTGHTREPANFRTEIERIEREHDHLQTQLAASSNGQRAQLAGEMERLNRLLASARSDYTRAAARQATGASV